MNWLIRKFIGNKHQRDARRMRPTVARINAIEQEYQQLSDSQLQAKTEEFKDRLAGKETLDDILPEAFAAVKNACRRLQGTKFDVCGHELVWDMVPFDVQLMGGIALHQCKIAEMATGEGKTLVATMPLYLNALTGRNVHLVTVNDYLARRDSQWMGLIYRFLGLTIGCIQNAMRPDERRAEYAKDITYGTNSEFGFDYLRDHGMAYRPDDVVQRGYFFAIVDEIDSILVDEARTPLIISGPVPSAPQQYETLKPAVERLYRKQLMLCDDLLRNARQLLEKGEINAAKNSLYQVRHGMPKHPELLRLIEDAENRRHLEQVERAMLTDIHKEEGRALREELFFTIDERGHDATLTEKGCSQLNPADPDVFVMPDLAAQLSALDGDTSLSKEERTKRHQEIQADFARKSDRIHSVDQLIRAYCIYERDVEYVVQNNQVLIVDEFTGRILPGRRWSDGLHQAVEAKEGVRIENETQTLATITIQNYFRMYEKLAGMTGTAETEANEFKDIYGLEVIVVPTNRPVRRVDYNDLIYRTKREKYDAIVDEVLDCHAKGQPVLVGTVSVETSELISRILRSANIAHNVLNAKNHQREAEIVTMAGQPGAVTIATNMAGRGTDIKLGSGVVWVDRNLIQSNHKLSDPFDGETLLQALMKKPCGLRVIGSERHEARRIDRQLRGRCARQGDPGSSRFYISLEDDLMRLFGSERISNFMARMGMQEGEPMEHRLLNRSVETAQRRVEQHNYYIRKRTLEYDDVMNKQREIIYKFRGQIVCAEHPRSFFFEVVTDVLEARIEQFLDDSSPDALDDFSQWARLTFMMPLRPDEVVALQGKPEELSATLLQRIRDAYDLKVSMEGDELRQELERHILLHSIDSHWQDFLRSMDGLRQGVSLRAYGQKDPLVEFKREAYDMFATLMDNIKRDMVSNMFRATIISTQRAAPRQPALRMIHDDAPALASAITGNSAPMPGVRPSGPSLRQAASAPARHSPAKVGRNDPCPCGSGKKFKKCCGV